LEILCSIRPSKLKMATNKCPYCYRPLGTHTHDPILLLDGCPYKWSNDTTLISESDITQREYKGTYHICETEIIELRTELETLEVENGVTPLSIFSPLNTSGKFQFTGYHLKEMRNSIEKILTATGMTKTEYFNYDDDRNHIIHPNGDKLDWTDPVTLAVDLEGFQIKATHIEELRHYTQTLWEETWDKPFIFAAQVNVEKYTSPPTTPPYTMDWSNSHLEADHIWGDYVAWDSCTEHAGVGEQGWQRAFCLGAAQNGKLSVSCDTTCQGSGVFHWNTASTTWKYFWHAAYTGIPPYITPIESWISLNNNTKFKIENMRYWGDASIGPNLDYPWIVLNPPPGMTADDIPFTATHAQIWIGLGQQGYNLGYTTLKYIKYIFVNKGGGKIDTSVLTNGIFVGESGWDYTLFRNLYEDYKTMYGHFPDIDGYNTINEIRFLGTSQSAADARAISPPPYGWEDTAFGSSTTLAFQVGVISIGGISS